MFAFLAAVAFGIAAFRDFFTTAPGNQFGWLMLGLTFVALHWTFGVALPGLVAKHTNQRESP